MKYGIVQALRIQTSGGSKLVDDFQVVGPLAVYESAGYFDLWTVGHIASGYCVTATLPSKEAALSLAEQISGKPFDWNFDDFRAVRKWPETHKKNIERLVKLAQGAITCAP